MRIVRGETENFSDHDIIQERRFRIGRFQLPMLTETERLQDVVEADEATGLVIQHMREDGLLAYSNGADTILMDNPTKALMLVPEIRRGFYAQGYRPKLETRYLKNLRIIFRGAATVQAEEQRSGEMEELPEMPVIADINRKRKQS